MVSDAACVEGIQNSLGGREKYAHNKPYLKKKTQYLSTLHYSVILIL